MRNKKWLEYIKTCRCVICSTDQLIDGHHVVPGRPRCSDFFVVPLCRTHHDAYHNDPVQFTLDYDYDPWKEVSATLAQAIFEGTLEVKI